MERMTNSAGLLGLSWRLLIFHKQPQKKTTSLLIRRKQNKNKNKADFEFGDDIKIRGNFAVAEVTYKDEKPRWRIE